MYGQKCIELLFYACVLPIQSKYHHNQIVFVLVFLSSFLFIDTTGTISTSYGTLSTHHYALYTLMLPVLFIKLSHTIICCRYIQLGINTHSYHIYSSMIHTFVDTIVELLKSTNMSNWLITMLVSFLPMAELRLGIPIGMRLGLSNLQSWLFAFVGSSLAVPVVLICFAPLLDKLGHNSKLSNISRSLTTRLQSKANKVDPNQLDHKHKTPIKRMLAVTIFVALPGPLTGVWGGSAVASLLKLSFWSSLISVVVGNLIASLLVFLLSDALDIFLDYFIVGVLILISIGILNYAFKLCRRLVKHHKNKAIVD
jgi:uncharacterized membrane protein